MLALLSVLLRASAWRVSARVTFLTAPRWAPVSLASIARRAFFLPSGVEVSLNPQEKGQIVRARLSLTASFSSLLPVGAESFEGILM